MVPYVEIMEIKRFHYNHFFRQRLSPMYRQPHPNRQPQFIWNPPCLQRIGWGSLFVVVGRMRRLGSCDPGTTGTAPRPRGQPDLPLLPPPHQPLRPRLPLRLLSRPTPRLGSGQLCVFLKTSFVVDRTLECMSITGFGCF